jgi:hypothetical protein
VLSNTIVPVAGPDVGKLLALGTTCKINPAPAVPDTILTPE